MHTAGLGCQVLGLPSDVSGRSRCVHPDAATTTNLTARALVCVAQGCHTKARRTQCVPRVLTGQHDEDVPGGGRCHCWGTLPAVGRSVSVAQTGCACAQDVTTLVATEMGLPEDTHHCYSVHECFDGVTSACSAVPAPSSPTSPCRLRSWPAVGRCAQCCVHHGCVRLPPAIVVAVRAVWLTRTVWLAWNR